MSDNLIDLIFNLSIISILVYHYTGKRLDNIYGSMLLLMISNIFLRAYFIDYLLSFSIINLGTKIAIKFL
jgi:hypothetical protein